MGTWSSSCTESTTPPLAVPSSLVRTTPVKGTISPKFFAWLMAFCPVVASRTRRVWCGASGMTFFTTRLIFANSSMRLTFVCKRPAVSMITTSAPRALAAETASKATAAGSAPSACFTMSAPVRSAQMVSCSEAAARKVSAAARRTFFPSLWRRPESLPMVVVLPTPLTPTTRMTSGWWLFS